MLLEMTQLLELSRIAVSAVKKAGQYIIENTGLGIAVKQKDGGDSEASQVVTDVDHACQKIILGILAPACKAYNLAVLAEESVDTGDRLKKDYFWSVDPLDGTLPFVEGIPGYAVSIALVSRQGVPLIGVVFDPVEQTLYQGCLNFGVSRNEKPWDVQLSPIPSGQLLTFVSDRSFSKHPLYDTAVEALKQKALQMGYSGIELVSQGGAVMNGCWTLENAPACYFKFPKSSPGGGSLWDYGATACIFNEIGAMVSDIYGTPLDLNRADSTFLNHRGILYATDRDIADAVIDIYDGLC